MTQAEWFLLTPAQTEPRLVGPVEWLGPPWALIREWQDATPDSDQEEQLRDLWTTACAWSSADEIEIEGGIELDRRLLRSAGFAPRHVFSIRSMPFPMTTRWSLAADRARTLTTLARLRELAGVTLVARSQGVERLRLRGDSWDAVYLNIEGLHPEKAWAQLQSMLAP